MKESSIAILAVHAAILVFQLIALRVFPHIRKALLGVYFILMPIGFGFFMPQGPLFTTGLVLAGLLWVLYFANMEVGRTQA
jgi:hypothetical protein